MAVTINASTTNGLVQTADTTGNLSLQSNGTTIAALTSTGVAVTGAGSFTTTLGVTGTSTLAAVNASGKITVSTTGSSFVGLNGFGSASSPLATAHIRGSGTSGQVTASWLLENSSSGTAGMDLTGAPGSSYWRLLVGAGPGTGTNTLTEAMRINVEASPVGAVTIPGTLGVTGLPTFTAGLKVGAAGASLGRFFGKQASVTGGAGATSIKAATSSEGSLYLVSGLYTAGAKRFTDLVMMLGASSSTPTTISAIDLNTPATRTYSRSGENLFLALSGTDAYTVNVTGMGCDESA